MANKFGSPLERNELWITQNYHVNSSNRAIDISANANENVLALADGAINKHYTNLGSYCTFNVNGCPIRIFDVHTYDWIPSGTPVKKGDKIAKIAPTSLNGGHATHIHLGTDLSHNLMDYMDRNIVFKTSYQDIADDWFNGKKNSPINWNLFPDLDYITGKPVVLLCSIGQRFIFTGDMNLRNEKGEIKWTILKGAVGEITAISTFHDHYQWYKMKFGDAEGYVADTSLNEIIVRDMTNLDGSCIIIPVEIKVEDSIVIQDTTPVLTTTLEVPETPEGGDNGSGGTITPPENTDPSEGTAEPQTGNKEFWIKLMKVIVEWFKKLLAIKNS
jgi:hypothetical protein